MTRYKLDQPQKKRQIRPAGLLQVTWLYAQENILRLSGWKQFQQHMQYEQAQTAV